MSIENLSKPLLSGVTAGLVTRFLTYKTNSFGEGFSIVFDSNIPVVKLLNGKSMSLAVATALAVGSASLGAAALSSYVFPFLHSDQFMENPLSAGFQLASVAGGATLVHYAFNGDAVGQRGLMNIIGLAIASEVVGSLLHQKVVRPRLHDMEEPETYDY